MYISFIIFTLAKIKDSIVNYVQCKDQTSEFINSKPFSLCMVFESKVTASSMESGFPKICTSTIIKLIIFVLDSEIYACIG